jgi:2,3-bisphosphoglycerate-independent phosphoglycerate mutase
MGNLLGEVVSNSGLKQLRIAETQKFKHVTSFFNGKLTTPYKDEKQVEIKGSFDPALFAEHPEMNAYDVTEALLKEMKETAYPFIAVNFANCDMVGHTGNYDAARKAVEVTDECVGKVVSAVLASDGVALITSDHGNAEEMFDEKSGLAKTSHTKNPVECIFVANDTSGVTLRKRGILADIAPTVLALLGIDKPKEMTAENLVQ